MMLIVCPFNIFLVNQHFPHWFRNKILPFLRTPLLEFVWVPKLSLHWSLLSESGCQILAQTDLQLASYKQCWVWQRKEFNYKLCRVFAKPRQILGYNFLRVMRTNEQMLSLAAKILSSPCTTKANTRLQLPSSDGNKWGQTLSLAAKGNLKVFEPKQTFRKL